MLTAWGFFHVEAVNTYDLIRGTRYCTISMDPVPLVGGMDATKRRKCISLHHIMVRTRSFLPFLCGLLFLSLTACEDPSNVGIGLINEQGEPEVRTLSASLFEAEPFDDITGSTDRALAGLVNDPLVGLIASTGYIDFQSAFDTTGNPTIEKITLELVRDYTYGDTVITLSLDVYDIDDDWDDLGAKADTMLTKGEYVTSFNFTGTDSLISFELPQDWLDSNAETIGSTTFSGNFHGFALETESEGAVAGFAADISGMRVFTDRDTTLFPMTRVLSSLSRNTDPTLPEGRVLVQDGIGASVRFDFPFEDPDLAYTPLNGALIRLFADSMTVNQTPPNFSRPTLDVLQLVRITSDSLLFTVGQVVLDGEGHYRFTSTSSTGGIPLNDIIQTTLLPEADKPYDHFKLRAPVDDNTINVILLHDDSVVETTAEAVLTLSPFRN